MIRVGLGQAEHIDTRTAVESVISQCRQNLGGAHPQAGIVFAGVNFDFRLMLDEILNEFPGIELIGCTSAGDFSSILGFSDDSRRELIETLCCLLSEERFDFIFDSIQFDENRTINNRQPQQF